MPRGHNLSTRNLAPSAGSAVSYSRLSLITVPQASFLLHMLRGGPDGVEQGVVGPHKTLYAFSFELTCDLVELNSGRRQTLQPVARARHLLFQTGPHPTMLSKSRK